MSEAEQTKGTTGRLLAGRYRLGEVLGRGGMGTVWRAEDEILGRTVAVKELRFSSNVDEDEKQRLITRTLREAKAIARIRSSGAVTVYDVVNEDDRPWIVMELIEGSSLADVIRESGTLNPHRTAEVGLAVLDVLRAAHREGILHRDVKPSNVLISEDGRVVLTDFGIAQVEGDPSVTSTGMLVGAPSYISPERARGQKPGPPADLWSLGGLLYACVEGAPPYDKGSAIATLTAVMTEPLERPKNAGPLEEVIYGLLDKDPNRRLDDAGARDLLTRVLNAPEDQGQQPPEPDGATRILAMPPVPTAGRQTWPEQEHEHRSESAEGSGTAAQTESAKRAREALSSLRSAAPAAATRDGRTHTTPAATARPGRPAGVFSRTDGVPKRPLLILAAIVALAVLGTMLVFALGNDGSGKPQDDKGTSNPGKSASPEASSQSTEGNDKRGKGSQNKGGSSKKPKDDKGGNGQKSQGLPNGYKMLTDSGFHFAMALPEGWHRTGTAGQNSGGIYSKSGGFPRVQVDFTPSPGSDAAAAWRSQAPIVARTSPGYRKLYIKEINYRGYPTAADWAFIRNQSGQQVRVLNRGFRVNSSHGYAIMITCRKGAWDEKECTTLRDTAFRTFQPKD